MNGSCYERVCYEHDLLWRWSVMNGPVMNVVCCERGLLWTGLLWAGLLRTWSVMNGLIWTGLFWKGTLLNTSAGRWSMPQAWLDWRPEVARTSVRVDAWSRQVMGGSEGRESRKEVSEGFFLFWRVLKCSAHRERIPSRSLMSNVPVLSFTWQKARLIGPNTLFKAS